MRTDNTIPYTGLPASPRPIILNFCHLLEKERTRREATRTWHRGSTDARLAGRLGGSTAGDSASIQYGRVSHQVL